MLRAALILTLLSSPAMAFQSRNDLSVSGTADQITVTASAGQGPAQSWCAAGDFAIRALGLPGSTLIYRVTPPPRRSGESVLFSTQAEGASEKTGLIVFGDQTDAISAGFAQGLCLQGRWAH